MAIKEVKVPDLSGATEVDVIDILVSVGDEIALEDSLITVEGDKASMDVPAPMAGKVKELKVKVGDKVSEGTLILLLEESSGTENDKKSSEDKKEIPEADKTATASIEKKKEQTKRYEIKIPDLSGAANVDVIELLVKPGNKVKKEEGLITLEGDKASMDVPAPISGVLVEFKVKVGDKVNEGDPLAIMEIEEEGSQDETAAKPNVPQSISESKPSQLFESEKPKEAGNASNDLVHAGPAVRRLAREFGVNLQKISGTGSKGRILKEDIQNFVKSMLKGDAASSGVGLNVAPAPKIDFSKFGEIETKSLSKIKKLTGINTHRSWVSVPHVTQFDEADITEMEEFRKTKNAEVERQGYKLTPLVFLMKAAVKALQKYPNFNSSLDVSGENIILKKYFHIGVAVDTPNGLVVPVIRDVDKKGLLELSDELKHISSKAREKGLMPNEMSGSCFTISSLGGVGGTAFTPIVNAPDVAILGVSKAKIAPLWNGKEFVPRLMLPLSLSYDHRVIDGAEAARFTTLLSQLLSDIRGLLL